MVVCQWAGKLRAVAAASPAGCGRHDRGARYDVTTRWVARAGHNSL